MSASKLRITFLISALITVCLAPTKLLAEDYLYGVSVTIPLEKHMLPILRPFVSQDNAHFGQQQTFVSIPIVRQHILEKQWPLRMNTDENNRSQSLKELIGWYGLGITVANLGIIYFGTR